VKQAAALDGIRKLASEAEFICGGQSAPKLDGIDSAKSAFVAPTLLKVESADKARTVHDTEVFGPAATKRAKADAQNATASEALAP
jgi:acyl-CoA reductase-like NAD-dependent aldehyde dehydrogenase